MEMTAQPNLPNAVRYIKNGEGGRWWKAAKVGNQLHAGWSNIPVDLLKQCDLKRIRRVIDNDYANRKKKNGATQDFNALCSLLDKPSQYVWVTFENGEMWWCTVHDEITPNDKGESIDKGYFWLTCDRNWSNKSLGGRSLAIDDIPGDVTKTAGTRGTVCVPGAWQSILRIIQDKKDPYAMRVTQSRESYKKDILALIKHLSWKDFEQLIDHIFTRSGWARISTLGKTREGLDLAVENVAIGEKAYVQVKSVAGQKILDNYVGRFKQERDRYDRMIFAVHSPEGILTTPPDLPVHVWKGDEIAGFVVRLGLGEWVASRFA